MTNECCNPAAGAEAAVARRYASAAKQPEAALCCAVDYDPQFLAAIPREVVEKDYGCGDPSRHLRPGETVLDLGSGTGKICFIAAQVVGREGRVIGIDMTDEMLEVARRNAPLVAEKIGYANVEFRKGRIQDLALNAELLEQELRKSPVSSASEWFALDGKIQEWRRTQPLVPSNSIDVVVSNCVLNLVEHGAKSLLFCEIHRVLKPGGRAVISDIVSDQTVPENMQHDPELWSGCISGALTEKEFIGGFERAGFSSVQVLEKATTPWQVVEGIEFRSVTIEALKGRARDFRTCC